MPNTAGVATPWGDTRVERFWCTRDASIHVDDNGFLSDPAGHWGRAVNPNVVSIDALREPRCVVIVGEPGSGKSETLRLHAPLLTDPADPAVRFVQIDLAEYGTEDRLARGLFEHPDVVAWRAAVDDELCVVLDSLDECKERIAHIATLLGAELARWPTDRLYLRICSRTADWPESLQPVLQRLFPDVGVFELLPLRREDVETLAQLSGVDGRAFVAAVRSARVGAFAAKPLTLALLLRIYLRDGRLPSDTADLYREALLLLSEEPNAGRRDAQAVGVLPGGDRVAVAARLAALSIFGHRAAFWTGRSTDTPGTDLAARDCVGGVEPADGVEVAVTEAAVRDTLRSGLFSSRGAGRVGWAHQTFAEHLAARFLIAHGVRPKPLRDLLLAFDGLVYPQLRPVAAWLVALGSREFDWLLAQDPELLLTSPVDISHPDTRRQAVDGLFRRAAAGDYSHRFGQRFDGLAYPGMDVDIRPHLLAGTRDERGLAIDVAGDCRLTLLRDDLVGMVLDVAEDYRLRVLAAAALLNMAPATPTTELRDLALAPTGDDDPDDELKGYALRLSWPHVVSTADVLAALTPPRRRNLLGAYSMFVEHEFPDALTTADVVIGLDWLLGVERAHRRYDRLDRLADRIVALALDVVDQPGVVDRLAELVMLRAADHQPLFVDDISGDPKPQLTADQRHALLDAVFPLVTPENAIRLVGVTKYGPGLVTNEDLDWLIRRFDSSPAHGETLTKLITRTFHPDKPGHAQIALALPEGHELRTGALRHWFEPVDPASEHAQRERDRWRMVRGEQDEDGAVNEPPPEDDSVEQRIGSWLDTFDAGDPAGFWQACFLVYLRPGASVIRLGDEYDPDLTAQPRWAVLSEALRDRLVRAARVYLDLGDCNTEAWLGTTTLHRPAYAGYRALVLLLRCDPQAIDELTDEVWRRWAPIIFAMSTAHGEGQWDDKHRLLEYAKIAAADELIATATRLIDAASTSGMRISLDRELAVIWSESLSAWLRDAVTGGRLADPSATDALALLAKHDLSVARPLLREMLNGSAEANRRAQAGALLLAHDATPSGPLLYQLLRDEPAMGERMIFAYLDTVDYHERPPVLSDRDLADLYLWLLDRFRFEDDPQLDDVHIVGPREQVAQWRDHILRYLQDRGTASAVEAIARIEAALPQHAWLRAVRRDAEMRARANTWASVSPRELLELVADSDRRLVSTAAQLLDVVLDALTTIQARLTGETPESHLLWDSRSGRPKQEDEISDYLLNRLRDRLSARGIVVNREVQVRRTGSGIGERTDIRIDAAPPQGADEQVISLVIEVKGAWHRDLLDALRTQLVDRYMHDLAIQHGIYLVAWPDLDSWRTDDADRRTVQRRPRDATQADLERRAREVETEGLHVAVVPLSIAYGRRPPHAP